MKNNIYTMSLLGLLLMASCDNNRRDSERLVNDLRLYVDSVKAAQPDYNDENYWRRVESGYVERKRYTEEKLPQMDAKMKADYQNLQADYEEMKAAYNQEREKTIAAMDYRIRLRNSLYGEGVIGRELNFGFMTAENAAQVYEHFVKTVKANRDSYSREDWDEIKVLYEAMDTRKNEIEKQLPAKDNLKIAGYKVEFSAIKSVNRPLAKIRENQEAKERGGK